MSYGQSKTANVLFSVALDKRFASQGINSNALMPGGIKTGLQKHMSVDEKRRFGMVDENGNECVNPRFKTMEQGASTTVWACVAPELEGKGGLYLEDCAVAREKDQKELMAEMSIPNRQYTPVGVCPHALDESVADQLWTLTEKEINERRQ